MRKKLRGPMERLEAVELDSLSPLQRKNFERAYERVVNQRDYTLSLKFRERDVAVWRDVAEKSKEKNFTRWIERVLNKAAEKAKET